MYKISRREVKPDIKNMETKVRELMDRGIRLKNCVSLVAQYNNMRDTLYTEFVEKYGIKNPNSAVQLNQYLQGLSNQADLENRNEVLNICYDINKGKWTTNAEAMKKLADLGFQFAQDLLDYRHVKKYAESVNSLVSYVGADGLVHPKVSLGKTNRVNYSEPGLMTIPKKLLWDVIGPYKEGNRLYSVDIKNQEPHILFSMLDSDELKSALNSEEGIYESLFRQCFRPTAQANVLVDTLDESRVYSKAELVSIGYISPAAYSSMRPALEKTYYKGKKVIAIETICINTGKGEEPELPSIVKIELEDDSIEEVEVEWEEYKVKKSDYSITGYLKGLEIEIVKAERNEFKTAWLAMTYGAGYQSIKENCKLIDGERVYKFNANIKALKTYRSQIEKLAKQGISKINTIFGTQLDAGYTKDWKQLKRVMSDLPIQGSGADILSILFKRVEEYTAEKGLADKISIYFTRHDEFILEIDREWENEVGENKVKDILIDMLEHQIDDWKPFKVEVKVLN